MAALLGDKAGFAELWQRRSFSMSFIVAGKLAAWNKDFISSVTKRWQVGGGPCPLSLSIGWERTGAQVDMVEGPSVSLVVQLIGNCACLLWFL